MRNTRVGVGIGLALGALGLSASAAVAAGASDIDIQPGKASPGTKVIVSTKACGPDVTYGKGESKAGGAFHLFEGESKGELTGEFELPEGTKPGSDTVTLKCPPRIKVTDTYQITDHEGTDHEGSDHEGESADHEGSDHEGEGSDHEGTDNHPNGSVDAGFGPPQDRGTQFALGGVLLAGAVAGGCGQKAPPSERHPNLTVRRPRTGPRTRHRSGGREGLPPPAAKAEAQPRWKKGTGPGLPHTRPPLQSGFWPARWWPVPYW